MAGNIGYAVLPVVPSTKDFQKKLNKQVLSAVDRSGKKASSVLTKNFKSAFGEMEKASVKAQKAQEKSIAKVEKAEERLQKLRDRNADRQRITANKEKQLADTRVRLANQIAKQEQKVQKMRESGRSSLERIQQEESKLNKLRTEAPGKILKKEVAIKKSRETGRDVAKKLSQAEKDLALAQKTSAEATKKASDLQAKLNGKEGQAAKRKDALRASVQKVAIAYGHFERSVETAGRAVGSFSAKLGSGVLASVKRLGSAVSSTAKKIATSLGGAAISQVQRFANSIKTGMTRATQAVAAAGTAIAGASIFKGFNRLSAIEESTVKLKTFGINVEQAMNQANTAVKGTAFGLGDAATATAQMSAAGIQLGKDMQQSLGLIGDTAAITGASFNEISSVYSKIAAAGKLDGGTLDQLQDRGVAVLAALSKASGKTQQEIRKDISDGKVSYQEFADAMEASIGGAAQRSGETVKGSFANLGAALGRIGASMQENLFQKLPTIFGNLTEAVDNAAPAILAATGGISSAITQKLVELSQKVLEFSTQIPQIMQTISQNPAFISLKTAFEAIKTSVIQATPVIASMVGSTVIAGFTVLGQAAQAVAGSIAAIRDNAGQSATALTTKYSEALQNITTFTGQVFSAIPGIVGQIAASPVWGTLKSAISGVFDVAKQVLPIFWSLASALGGAAWQIASTAFQSISDGLRDSNSSAQPFADVIQNRIVPWIGEMADKISGLIHQYLPTFVSLLSEKLPQAMDTFANDPAFVQARDNIAQIAEQVIKLIPTFAKLAASGAFIGFSILNDLLQAIAPLLEKVVIPAVGKLSDYLAEHENVAKALAFTVGGIFAGGKIVKGIETVVGVFSKFKPVLKIGRKVIKWLPRLAPMIKTVGTTIAGVVAANPIGAIVVGIAAVITGLTLFFTKTKIGRKAWAKMMEGIKASWEKIGKPVFQAIGDIIGWLWEHVYKPFFGWIADRFKNLFKRIGRMRDAFKDAGSSIADAFSNVKDKIVGIIDSIKDKWRKFKDFITAPFKIGVKGAKGLWNKITGKKDGYASGGVLPGYTPGRDVHHYINPATGHVLSLSGGEAIMRPEWVRANGGSAGVARMNRAARGGRSSFGGNSLRHSRFASGGTVKLPNGGSRNVEIKNPNVNLDKADIKTKSATVNSDKIKQKIETGISNRKELADARAALYAARHKDPVGQAIAEKMQKQSALAEINSKLKNAKALGLSGHEVRVLKVQKLTAAKEFQEALAQPMKIAMDRAAEHRKTMGDLRADTYAKMHDTPVGQAISERMKASNTLKDLKYQRSKAIRDGESKSTIKEFNAQIRNAAIDARKAAKNVLLTSLETAAAHRKAMADYDADIYSKLHTDPVGQATAERMKAVATLRDLEAQKRRAIIEGKTAEEIAEFSKQIKIAGIDASDAAKKITLTAMETADNHRKAMSDYDADFYSKLHKDAVGQATAEKMRADATLRDLEAQKRRAIFEGKSVEEIQEFSAQIRNAGIDASEAAKKITLTAMETAANHRKAVGDLNADFYGKQNPGAVGQAIAERMKQENALNDLLAQRQRALIEGQPAEAIKELSLQIRNASYDLSEARKNIRKVRDEQRDTHRVNMKTLRAEWMSKANEGNPVAQAKADLYRSRADKSAARYELNRAKKYGASVQEITEANQKLKNSQLDVDSAFRKYVDSLNQQRVDLLKHNGSMRAKNLEIYEAKYFDNEAAMRKASIAKAKNAVRDAKDAVRIGKLTRASRLEMRELAKDVEVAQAQYIKAQKEAQKQLLEEQNSMYEEAYSYLQSWSEGLEKSGQSLVSSFETIASIGKDLSDISRNITESAFSLLSGISEVVKSFNNIITAERTLQRSRVEGLAAIAKAQGELQKNQKKNLKFVNTSASRLMDAQKASTGFYSTIDKLGGTFKVSTEDIQKSRAALAEARANAAMEAAKAEYDLKKARLESAKKIADQVKATGLLNNAMAEYIAKANLINGLNQRDTDSLAKYYQGVAQKTQGSSMMNAAQAQMAWAIQSGNMAKYQQALGQYYEGQKNASLGAYQMQLYVKEATKAFNALPSDISKGLRDAVARDNQSTRFAVDAALKRRDYDAANAAAKNAGALVASYIDTVAGFRQIQNDLISRNAQYQRDSIEFAGKMTESIFDLAGSKLDNSFDKATHALQANLDGAQALGKAADSETPAEKKIWSDYALKSLDDYEKSRKESSRYNRGVNDHYVIDIPQGSAYSSEEVADYMASATKRLDNIEIRLDGKSVAGSDYFYAH